jgi:hypothetical protein
MALVLKDRIKQQSTTTGTGTITLGASYDGFSIFSAFYSNGDEVYYTISNTETGITEWEVGRGTFNSAGPTLVRDTVLSSTNAGSLVSFSAGIKEVFVTYPAERAVTTDDIGTIASQDANNVSITAGSIAVTADPTTPLQVATKDYVDNLVSSSIHFHEAVRLETPDTAGNLSATYNNGTAGVGATLTNNSTQVALTIDGVTTNTSDRILVYNQTDATENGVYVVTDVGSGSTNWVLTRSADTNTSGDGDPNSLDEGSYFLVTDGDTGAGESYVCSTVGTITFGTTDITFAQFSSSLNYIGGTNIDITGRTISVEGDIAVADGGTGASTESGARTNLGVAIGSNVQAWDAQLDDIAGLATTDSNIIVGNGTNWVAESGATARTSLGVPANDGTGATGTWSISISGNAATATDGVVTTGSYADPAWITSLDDGKVLPSMTGNSGEYLTTDGTNSSWAAVPSPNNGTLSLSTSGNGLSGSATFTANQAGTSSFTVTSNATNASTANAIVSRDASGNFSAGTITASLSGNATTATTLQTARTINGVSFNGGANITVTANTSNTLTRGTYLTGLNFNGSAATTWAVDATNANTASKVVARDASGNFSAGTITAALSGNASTATTLQTARTINGTSFNGSANITVPANIATSATASAFKVPFANTTVSTTGNYGLLQDSTATFTYNPSTNTLTAGTFSGALSGNATTATTLQTARTINGVSFNGGANITVEPYIEDDEATAATRYLVFTDNSTAGFKRLNEDSSLTYTPSTGNLTTNGTVSAGSDERWKENWKEFGPNFIDELSQVKHGTYSRIDTKEIQVGVGAQSLQKVIPEAVNVDDKGYLNVAYGHAALASVVELAKEIVKLRAEIAELKSRSK